MLRVDPTISVAEAARLMTERAATSLAVADAGPQRLTYEDVIRALRRARHDLTVSALLMDDCADPAPSEAAAATAASDALPTGVEFSVTGMFEPDTLLASQYADRVRRRAEFDPERRLMIAVLELAVNDYTKFVAARDRRGRALFGEVEAWVESRDADWPFAFQSICDALELDADCLRRGLHAWKERIEGRTSKKGAEKALEAAEEKTAPHREAG